MNFSLPYFQNKNIVCIGKDKEMSSFDKFLESQYLTTSTTKVDAKDLDTLSTYDQETTVFVKATSIPGNTLNVAYTTPTRVFFDCVRQVSGRIVGVTGTKGKTTTSGLIALMLKNGGFDARLAGSEDKPLLDELHDITDNTVFVLELSSFQLNELTQSPDIAVLTNLFRDHIDYHGSIDAYWEAKHNIIRNMDENGTFIYNPQTEFALHWTAHSKAKMMPINPEEELDMSEVKLIGDHNRINILMARQAAELLGVERRITTLSYKEFEPVRHRLQTVKNVNGVTFIDDAIGSTPEATLAGIEALIKNRGPVGCVMLGGKDLQYDFSELARMLSRIGIPKLILFPETGAIIKDQLPDNYTPEIYETTDMNEAVKWAAEHTPSGSICLLSTASPDGPIWSSFEEKGSLFQQAVLELP